MSCRLSRGVRKARTRKMKIHKYYYRDRDEIIKLKQRVENWGERLDNGEPLPNIMQDRDYWCEC